LGGRKKKIAPYFPSSNSGKGRRNVDFFYPTLKKKDNAYKKARKFSKSRFFVGIPLFFY
jgi:hypothetical protein